MKKYRKERAPHQNVRKSSSFKWVLIPLVFAVGVVLVLVRGKFGQQGAINKQPTLLSERPPGSISFHKDIAPILSARCASCHRPGEAAPFSLLSFQDVAKHLNQVAQVTAARSMPPWMPEPGFGEFADARRLTETELGLIQQWVRDGAPEGEAMGVPIQQQPSAWELGEPDLVMEMQEPYRLGADGKDVYRNVVLPIPVSSRRFVKAIDFRPGNAKVVHHASLLIDSSGESRRLALKSKSGGFDGMQVPESASMVAGQILGWEPGKRPDPPDETTTWALEKNSDLVVQLHLHPSGKEELVQCSVAFYFSERAPERTPFLIRLPQWQIDIPAGATNYTVENSYTLPVDVSAIRISPHAHYLAREMQSFAILPDGSKRWLLWIRDWNFNWQGTYRFAQPVFLPKGSKVVMHFRYDNSTDNPRNPSNPPRRVRQGPETTDEMGQITLQVVTSTPQERQLLAQDHLRKLIVDAVAYNESVLVENPNDAVAHAKIGQAALLMGQFAKALEHLQAAIRLEPANDKPHYDLASLYLLHQEWLEAKKEFETVLRLNPNDYQAHGNLGSIYQKLQNPDLAEEHFRAALKLNPDDAMAAKSLELLRAAREGRP